MKVDTQIVYSRETGEPVRVNKGDFDRSRYSTSPSTRSALEPKAPAPKPAPEPEELDEEPDLDEDEDVVAASPVANSTEPPAVPDPEKLNAKDAIAAVGKLETIPQLDAFEAAEKADGARSTVLKAVAKRKAELLGGDEDEE